MWSHSHVCGLCDMSHVCGHTAVCVVRVTECRANRPVFGRSLESHLRQMDRELAVVIEECISVLYQEALDEEVRHCMCCNAV